MGINAKKSGIGTGAAVKKPIEETFSIPEDTARVVIVEIVGCEEGMLQNQLKAETKLILKGLAQPGVATTKAQKTAKAQSEWVSTGHLLKNGQRGHPAESFLKAMCSAGSMVALTSARANSKAAILRGVSILPDGFSAEGLPLCAFVGLTNANASDKVEPAEHWAINSTGGKNTPVPVYRTHIPGGWKMNVRVEYDSSVYKAQDILMLMQKAGNNVGIGAWRKEKGGVFGRFKLSGTPRAG